MKTFAISATNGPAKNSAKSLSFAADSTQAVANVCKHVAQTLALELIYTQSAGMLDASTIWELGQGGVATWEAQLRSELSAVTGVQSVDSITTSISGGVLSYVANITTDYGTTAING